MTKNELRKIHLQKRSLLSEGAAAQLSQRIGENFFAQIDLSFNTILHTFIPIDKTKEPDTWVIIDRVRREFPNVRLVVPRVNKQTGELENFYFEGLQQLEKNDWGIPEPMHGVVANPGDINAVLVPLLAFDKRGHRVGYGKGFYDKFLKQTGVSCRYIGLSFFEPVEHISDVEAFDVPLHLCVTPNEVYRFPG